MKRRASCLNDQSELHSSSTILAKQSRLTEQTADAATFFYDEREISVNDQSTISNENHIELPTNNLHEIQELRQETNVSRSDEPIVSIDSDSETSEEIDVIENQVNSRNSVNDDYLEIIEEIRPRSILNKESEEIIDLTSDELEQSDNQSFHRKLERISSVDIDECPICLERLTDLQSSGVNLCITACNHVMCIPCAFKVFTETSPCPMCRREITASSILPYCILT